MLFSNPQSLTPNPSAPVRLAAVLLAACWAAAAWANPPAGEPDYRAAVQKYVPLPLAGKRPDFVDRISWAPLRPYCEETAVLARLWQWTGRPEYAEEARQRLSALLDVWQLQRKPGQSWRRVCFFSAHPIIDAYGVLLAGGQLDKEFQARFRQFAREAFFPQEHGSFNQAFARAAGLAWAAKTLPDMPEATGWRKSAETVWHEWRQYHDTTENAAAYNGIALTYLFLLADGLGTTAEFQDPAARQMFARFRDQVSPSGAMPEYGDSGDAAWGMFHAWGTWVSALERAGTVCRDPGCRWAAARMFDAACRYRQPAAGAPAIDAMTSAYALCLADRWRDARLRPRPAATASEVTYRREPGNDRAFDKLNLAPSRQPGAPFAMAELYARWHHAHEDQLGAILYYECSDVPLLHGLGYHNRAAEQANVLLLCPAGEPFPHNERVVVPGAWRQASLPAGRLAMVTGAGTAGGCHFDKLTFRLEAKQPVALTVANLRLSGPKGDLVLDDFHGSRGWHGGQRQLVPGPAAGQQAMKAECHGGMTFIWRGGFDTTFSLGDYDRFQFSWKLEGIEDACSKGFIFRVDDLPVDYHVLSRPLAATITAAHTDARGSDQYGEFRAAGWFTGGTRLWRRMVLLAEGPLVVCDEVQPDAAADGWQAGPLWHLRAAPQAGANWYDAPGQQHLLVWLGRASDRTCGMQTTVLWSGTRPFTVFAKETLTANRPVRFVSVLLPHGAEVAAARLADSISARGEAGEAAPISLPGPTGTIRVDLDDDGAWSVRRERRAAQ